MITENRVNISENLNVTASAITDEFSLENMRVNYAEFGYVFSASDNVKDLLGDLVRGTKFCLQF